MRDKVGCGCWLMRSTVMALPLCVSKYVRARGGVADLCAALH